MSTPKKIKRGNYPLPPGGYPAIGVFSRPIDNTTAIYIGRVAADFTYTEDAMIEPFGYLLGMTGRRDNASLAFRAIVSTAARLTVMKNALEQSQDNADKGPQFDHIINEFRDINTERNKYVHGDWTMKGKTPYLAPTDGSPLGGFRARPVDLDKEVNGLLLRMRTLRDFISATMHAVRKQEPPPTLPQQSDLPK